MEEISGMDDDSFVGYIPNSTDPGQALLIATVIFSFATNAMIPCLVRWGNNYERRQKARKQSDRDSDSDTRSKQASQEEKDEEELEEADVVSPSSSPQKSPRKSPPKSSSKSPQKSPRKSPQKSKINNANRNDADSDDDDASNSNNGDGIPYGLDESMTSAASTEWKNILNQIVVVSDNPTTNAVTLESPSADQYPGGDAGSVVSSSASSFWDNIVVESGHRHGKARARGAAHRNKLMEQERLADEQNEQENASSFIIVDKNGVEHVGMTASELCAMDPSQSSPNHRGVAAPSSLLSGVSSQKKGDHSVWSKSDVDLLVSPQAAPSGPGTGIVSPVHHEDDDNDDDDEVDVCCGTNAWWQPSVIQADFDQIVLLSEWDHEMKRIMKICIPFCITEFLDGFSETLIVILVAQYLGTSAVAAFTIVNLIVGTTKEFLEGIVETEAIMCSHAIGVGNHKLAGEYVQVTAFLYTLFTIPNLFIWSFLVDDVIILFGFDEATAKMGQDYARVLLFTDWAAGMKLSFNDLLNVIDRENFVTGIGVLENLFMVAGTALVVLTRPETSLQELGVVHLGVTIVFLLFVIWYTIWMGWINKYLGGLFGSIGSLKTVRTVLAASMPLALGNLLEYGEWEVLAIFAAVLGPAEVAAWGILGSLWDTFEAVSKAIGDAGEIRCAYHLGNSKPDKAKTSAYKSVLISVAAAFFITSILWIMGEDLAVWISPDPTLQNLIADLIPLLGVGNITMTAGVVSWALVGAQARYRLATLVALLSSWGITMPLAAILTFGFRINLQGITAAVVIGYSVTCTALFYFLLRSDWESISKRVVEINEESDGESSSGSSSSDDDDSSSDS